MEIFVYANYIDFKALKQHLVLAFDFLISREIFIAKAIANQMLAVP